MTWPETAAGPDHLAGDARAGDLEEAVQVGEALASRYNDIKSGG